MKYVDFAFQSLLLLSALVMVILTAVDSDWVLAILMIQLCLGGWQLLSSVISVLKQTPLLRFKIIHLRLSAVYLVILFLAAQLDLPPLAMKLMFTVPAWSLAVYYFVITWHCIFRKEGKRGSFLPNVSF